jgi:dTDP-glucose 4,6-dehydratase
VLDLASTRGTRKFLYISSGAVYGKQPEDLTHVPEDYCGAPDPLDPRSAYGEGKRVGELFSVLESRKAGFEAKIVRCFAFIGPHLPLDAHFAAGNFIRDALAGGPIIVKGDGKSVRSYLYGADLAVWLWTFLFKGEPGSAYNVGSEHGLTISELADLVSHSGSLKLQVEHAEKSEDISSRYLPNCHRARLGCQLSEWTPLSESVSKTVRWYK